MKKEQKLRLMAGTVIVFSVVAAIVMGIVALQPKLHAVLERY